ncbi:hypothetical protein BC938DRAFT_481347 [Jimgerdemannia flammicorona]|uniref:Uncharacterized protein n=1 Tax=Jimgerdemannia flammicorona TaxID=994334 RepID=A0A433QGE0_9FUNG|nr:hypothetical protein BC938DRAFT_481347 [Jimgerdemannia flammicorona]
MVDNERGWPYRIVMEISCANCRSAKWAPLSGLSKSRRCPRNFGVNSPTLDQSHPSASQGRTGFSEARNTSVWSLSKLKIDIHFATSCGNGEDSSE